MVDIPTPSPGLVGPQGQELQNKVTLTTLTQILEGEKDRVKVLQQQVKILKDSGGSFNEINKTLEKAGVSAVEAKRGMEAFYSSMNDLMKMRPHELFRNLESVVGSLGKMALPALTLGGLLAGLSTLVDIFKMLDSAAAKANKTLATMAIQSGTLGNISGIGGVFGRAGAADDTERKKMTDQYYSSALAVVRMGYSADQAAAVMGDVAMKLPIQFTAAAPEFAKTIAAVSRMMEMDLGTTTELMTTAFRRGITSAHGLSGMLDGLKQVSKATSMPLDMVAKQFSELWGSTRQFGAATTEVQQTMMDFGSALSRTLLSVQEVAQGFNGMKELSIPKIVALFESLQGAGTSNERKSLFGSANTPEQAIEEYLKRSSGKGGLSLEEFQKAQLAALKGVASTITGVGPRTAFEMARAQFPIGYQGGGEGNRELSQRISTGLSVSTPAGPFSMEDSGLKLKSSFDGVAAKAIHLTNVTSGVADEFSRLKEELKLASGAASQGRFGIAGAALNASGVPAAMANANPITAAINFTVHVLTPSDADDVGRQTAHHLKNILADTKRKGS